MHLVNIQRLYAPLDSDFFLPSRWSFNPYVIVGGKELGLHGLPAWHGQISNGKAAEFCTARELGKCSENHTSAFWHFKSTEKHSLGTEFWKTFMLVMKTQGLSQN